MPRPGEAILGPAGNATQQGTDVLRLMGPEETDELFHPTLQPGWQAHGSSDATRPVYGDCHELSHVRMKTFAS